MSLSYGNTSLSAGAAQNQAAPVANGEIVDALLELNRVLDGLEVTARSVFARLTPVLQPESDIAGRTGAGDAPRNTPFGAELAQIQGRVERLQQHAMDVSLRLALP